MALSRTLRLTALPTELRQSISISAIRHYSSAAPASPAQSTHSSVSSTELSHFSALASSWWDPHGPSRILHLMNPFRHQFINRCHASTSFIPAPNSQKYLDIGCGGGIFAESAARLSTTASVTAIDPTPDVIAVALKHRKTDPLLQEPGRLTYLNTALEHLPLPATPSQGVDVLTLFEVIEHIERPAPFLQNALKHVKPGGWLILSTISRTWTSWLTTKVMAEDVMRVVPRGTHDWNQYINADEMRSWAAKQEGWSRPETMGVVYVPGIGWREVRGSEAWGNYFFGIRRDD